MLITDNFVFLEIPASGGELIRPALLDDLPDASYSVGKKATYDEVPTDSRGLPGFYVVRSPWTWYVSWAHAFAHRATRKGEMSMADPDKRVIWEEVFRFGEARFKEIVTRLCVGDFEHPVTPIMREDGVDFYSARVKQFVGEGLARPDYTALRFEQLRGQLRGFLSEHAELTPELSKTIRGTPTAPDAVAPQLDYDEALVELVGEKAAWFCERFGYPLRPGPSRTPA